MSNININNAVNTFNAEEESKGKRISVSLNSITLNNLDELCGGFGLTRSAMFSFILNDFFMKYQKDKKEA